MFKSLFKKKTKTPPPTKDPIEENQQTHIRLKKGWDEARISAGGKVVDIQEIYYTTSGSIYYSHTNILDMSIERQIHLGKALKGLEYGLSSKYLDNYERKMEKYLEEGKADKAKQLLQDFKLRRKKLPEERLLLEVALCMFYRHDENPYTYSPLLQVQKLTQAEEDANLRAFFILGVWEIVRETVGEEKLEGLNILSGQDFLTYLLTQALQK
jgi:hypothetical protein